MGYPTPFVRLFLCVVSLAAAAASLFGHYRENPDEATRPPQILREPEYTVIPKDSEGSLAVFSMGAGELSYQWYQNHVPIEGANSNILTITGAKSDDSGFYHVEILSEFGAAVSEIVILKVEDLENTRGVDRNTTGLQTGKSMIEWFGSAFIAASDSGKLSRSEDGVTWEELEAVPVNETVLDMVVGGDRVLFVIEGGNVAHTQDFAQWQVAQIDPESNEVISVVYSLGVFAAIVDTGSHIRLLTTFDGIEWREVQEFSRSGYSATLSATSEFILATAGSSSEGTDIAISNNGEDWTVRNDTGLQQIVGQMSFEDAVVLESRLGFFYLTREGNRYSILNGSFDQDIEKTAQLDGAYYALGVSNAVYRSTDLADWEKIWDEFPNSVNPPYDITPEYPDVDLTFAPGNEVIMVGPIDGSFYPVKGFYRFRPSKFPARRDTLRPLRFEGIEFVNGQFVIRKNPGPILLSENGSRWREQKISPTQIPEYTPIGEYAYGNGYYVKDGSLGRSILDMQWHGLPENFLEVRQLVFGNGKFVGTVDDGIYYSSNGLDWKLATTVGSLEELIFAEDRFLAVEANGAVHVSSDGIAWTGITLSTDEIGANSVSTHLVYGDGRYIASFGNDTKTVFYESTDGVSWTKSGFDSDGFFPFGTASKRLLDMAWGDGKFLLLFDNRVFESEDFSAWNSFPFVTNSLFELQYGAGSFVAIGREGRIVQFGQPAGITPFISFRNPPSVFTSPSQIIELQVDAYHFDGIEGGVEIYEDGRLIRTIDSPPFLFDWSAPYSGSYSLRAQARSHAGIVSMDTLNMEVTQHELAGQGVNQHVRFDSLVVFQDAAFAIGDDGFVYRSSDASSWQRAFIPDAGARPETLGLGDGFIFAEAGNEYYLSMNGKEWLLRQKGTFADFAQNGDWIWFPTNSQDSRGRSRARWSRDLLHWNEYGSIPGAYPRDLENRFDRSDAIQEISADCILIRGPWGDLQCIVPPVEGIVREAKLVGDSIYSMIQVGLIMEAWKMGGGQSWVKVGEFDSPALGGVEFEKIGNLSIVKNTQFDSYKLSVDDFQTHTTVSGRIVSVVYQNERYVGLVDTVLSYSDNGVDWVPNASGLGGFGALWAFQDRFLADLNDQGIFISSDGIEWESVRRDSENSKKVRDFAFDGTRYAALLGPYWENEIGFSLDGESWESFPEARIDGDSIIYANGQLIATGQFQNVFLSDDGVIWNEFEVAASVGRIHGITQAPGSGLFVLETREAAYWTSPDAKNWTSQNQEGLALEEIKAEGSFLFATVHGPNVGITSVYRSADGIEWSLVPELFKSGEVFFENGVYLASTRKGEGSLVRSLDGVNWVIVDHPISKTALFLRALGNEFHVSLSDGRGYASKDGLTWWRSVGNEIPLLMLKGEDGNRYSITGSNVFSPKNVDLSLEISNGLSETQFISEIVDVVVSIANRGEESMNLEGMAIGARLSENDNWTESLSNRLDDHVLPDLVVEPGGNIRFSLNFEIPKERLSPESSIQLLLNPEQIVTETNLSNNYAWMRLLPAPEISIGNQSDDKVSVSWSREGGYVNRIEYSHDLENWFLLDAPEETAESGTYVESASPDRETFYRVKAE